MEATEKCDVDSFGVVTLEIIMGRHPGDVFSSISSDVMDQRFSPPTKQEAEEVVSLVKIASASLNPSPWTVVSSNDAESFLAPHINSEAAFVKAIAYENIW
ncbi:hypothetical protein PRUPE_7G014400 [Prunus persica]|uniref:non-specific serine/threonine protein kinase n=1 Tax=Prunus persica TaxID=3760 RepID=M5W4J2_PRUPE|nr:hypothetical protein PRUPE_7G014400 [Prunus persica]